MHEHRRHDDPDDLQLQQRRLERLAESSVARVGGRLVTPVLVTALLGIVTWLGNRFIAELDQQGRDIAQVKSDVRVLGTRLDAQVIQQVDANSKRIDRLEDRVSTLERSVPTP